MLNQPCILGINPTWSWCVILCCVIQFADSLFSVHPCHPIYLHSIAFLLLKGISLNGYATICLSFSC